MSGQIEYYKIGESQVIKNSFRYDGRSGNKCLSTYHMKRSNGDVLKVLVTTWSMDEQVEFDVCKIGGDKEGERIFSFNSVSHDKTKETSRIQLCFNSEKQFLKESYRWLIQRFADNGIKLLKKTTTENVFYAEYSNRSEYQIFTIIDANLTIKDSLKIQEPIKQITPKTSRNFFVYLLIIIFFSGCFTMVTRQRVGCKCKDGSESSATGSGACSHHHGVLLWRYEYWWDK